MSGNPYHVKLGLWTNHSNGVWTLTLGSYWGAVLAAALVIYVGIIGTLFWMPVSSARYRRGRTLHGLTIYYLGQILPPSNACAPACTERL